MPHNGPSDSEIFDRALRRKRRDRAARRYEGFVREHMLEGIHDRLTGVTRDFRDVLDLGSFGGGFELPGAAITRIDAGRAFAAAAGGVQGDEDRHPFPEASFDLVVSVGVLDQINDVPGALALARRALRPDGLFLGAFLGAGTLATLRSVFLKAEGDRPVARFHPQIDGGRCRYADRALFEHVLAAHRPARHGGDQPAAGHPAPDPRRAGAGGGGVCRAGGPGRQDGGAVRDRLSDGLGAG
jgi:SAM-dependent methyltransferase